MRASPRPKQKVHRITDAALDAFREDDQPVLHRALGLRPWEASPLEALTEHPPSWASSTAWAASWAKAWGLRAEIVAALGDA